eukprot:354036-Chlamydomonas_euryale.AAC.3
MLAGQASVAGGQVWRFEALVAGVALELTSPATDLGFFDFLPKCYFGNANYHVINKFVSRNEGALPPEPCMGRAARWTPGIFCGGCGTPKKIQEANKATLPGSL